MPAPVITLEGAPAAAGDEAYAGPVRVMLSPGADEGDFFIRHSIDGTDVTDCSALYTAPFTLTRDATVKARAWQLGHGTSEQLVRKIQINAPAGASEQALAARALGHPSLAPAEPLPQVAAGAWHSLFVKGDGTLWAVGGNNYGQLGDGTTTGHSTMVQLATGVASVATGDVHSLFVKTDGTLWALGYNEFGQLGDGTFSNRPTPVQV
ncbi:MAG: chitobiase/beta-hexosaminidase C-terminal domain-containing protein, partial [Opitutaceae bacterium]|nr:chitobiase/beta-hexosaminidase C-terminal domain-containing protein [Opitutaceae bacterium]